MVHLIAPLDCAPCDWSNKVVSPRCILLHCEMQACRDALQLDSGYLDAHKELVRVLMAAEEWQPALDEARALLQAAQNDGDAHQVCMLLRPPLRLPAPPSCPCVCVCAEDSSITTCPLPSVCTTWYKDSSATLFDLQPSHHNPTLRACCCYLAHQSACSCIARQSAH